MNFSSKINVTTAVEQPKDPNDTSVSADTNIYLVSCISRQIPITQRAITVDINCISVILWNYKLERTQ
jgi:hypothetical protein